MFGIGGQELFFILLLALILLGPSKLPEIAKTLGKVMGEFQRASNDLKKEIDLAAEEKPQQQDKPAPEPVETENTEEKQTSPAKENDNPEDKTDLDAQPVYHPEDIER